MNNIDVKQFIDSLHEYLGKALSPISARLAAVEARLPPADAAQMVWRGAHDVGQKYGRGDTVQRSGALFVALTTTDETPGASAHWRRIAGGATP